MVVILKVNIENIGCCWAGIAASGSGRIQQLNQYRYYVLCSSYPSRRDSCCRQGSSLHLTRPAISPNSGHCRPSPSLGFIPSSKPPIIIAQAKLQLSIPRIMESDNSLWESEEGVPHIDDPFIQRFLAGRLSLIQREESQRHGSTPAIFRF